MRRHVCGFLLAVLPLPSVGAENPSALKALKLLPKTEMQSLARIEAHDGSPVPDRWYFLIHDPNSESGLKEYVVAAGELVAARSVSQFAERLTETDVMGGKALRVDSDMLAELAKNYAAVNDVAIDRISYQLYKEGNEAQPLWKLSCLNQQGQTIGTLVVTAAKGNVISHQGFPVTPKVSPNQAGLSFVTAEEPLVATDSEGANSPRSAKPTKRSVAATAGGSTNGTSGEVIKKSGNSTKRTGVMARRNPRTREARSASYAQPPQVVVRKASRPLGNILRSLFSFDRRPQRP